jgi:trigger factor
MALRRAFCFFGEPFRCLADRSDVSVIEVAHFDTVGERNAVPKPAESIRKDHATLGADGNAVDFRRGHHPVADAQVDLSVMGSGQCVRFPRGGHECQGYTLRPVKSTIESLEGNKVKLVIEVDEVEFDRNIDDAFRKIAKQVRIPGFRQGKAPRKLLEAQIGLDAARAQALQDSIPEYLAQAVRTHHVDLIATPDVKVTKGEDEGPISFDATCEVRPEITVPGYEGLRVELPSLAVTDAEVDEAVDSERKRHGKLIDVDREIAKGDSVSLDLTGTRDGTPVPGLNVEDWMYEVGKAWVSPSFDDKLVGAKAGDRIEYTEAPNGTTDDALISIVVKKVQELSLDELTDEWVSSNVAEFDSVEAWETSIRERLGEIKLSQARSVFVERTTASLAELVEIEAPEVMVTSDMQARVRNMVEQFQAQGISLDQWLSVTGQSTQGFVDAMREESVKAVKIDLALRAVATAREIEATEDELSAELDRIAMQLGRKVDQVRKAYEQNDAMDDLSAQIRKSKAVDWLLRNSTLVDADGNPVDAKVLFGDDDTSEDDLGND